MSRDRLRWLLLNYVVRQNAVLARRLWKTTDNINFVVPPADQPLGITIKIMNDVLCMNSAIEYIRRKQG